VEGGDTRSGEEERNHEYTRNDEERVIYHRDVEKPKYERVLAAAV
jgi:hypothetical protein